MEAKKKPIPTLKLRSRMIGEPAPRPLTEGEMINSIFEALNVKRDEAIVKWTIRKMGVDYFRRYVFPVEKRFLMVALLYTIKNNCDFLTAIRQVPYDIPNRTNKKVFRFDSHKMLDEYQGCLSKITRIKKRDWNSIAARLVAIKHALPGITDKTIKKYDSMPKASDVALDFIKWKYKLEVTREAVKKHLITARKEKRILRDIVKLVIQEKDNFSRLLVRIESLK